MSNIKDYFASRYGDEGVLIEVDWTALEIAAWAMHTRDPVLIGLLKSGTDLHKHVGSYVLNCLPEQVTKEQRQQIKPANFTLIYGGTDFNLVNKDKLEPGFAKQVYDTFWDIFKVSRQWSDDLMKELDRNAKPIDNEGNLESYYTGLTGRKWFFKNYPSKISNFCAENRIYTPKGFKYSEGMNYKVQGFATGDLHLIALGHLWRKSLEHRDKFLLINTVHDSILFDCHKKDLDFTCNFIQNELQYVRVILKDKFELDYDVPLKMDFKQGPSWGQMLDINLN